MGPSSSLAPLHIPSPPPQAPYFEDVNAIIFLAPISAFDQVLAEVRAPRPSLPPTPTDPAPRTRG